LIKNNREKNKERIKTQCEYEKKLTKNVHKIVVQTSILILKINFVKTS